jgi:hypothetical protein
MASGIGSIIEALDYNSIQTVLSNVMGVGTGNSGYGQALASSQVSIGDTITVAQMVALRNDLSKARVHQTNSAVLDGLASISSNIGTPWQTLQLVTTAITIQEAIRDQYSQFATGVQTNLDVTAASGQTTPATAVSTTYRDCTTSPFGGTSEVQSVAHTVTLTFPGYTQGSLAVSANDHIRCFFNAGGKVEISGNLSGWPADATAGKDQDWADMLSGFGILYFGASASSISGTVNSGGTVATTTGFRSLSIGGAPVQLIKQTSSLSVYQPNNYIVTVARPTTNTLSFVITFNDANAATYVDPAPGSDPGTGGYTVDEQIEGNLYSYVNCTRPSGSNVDVPSFTASSTAIA